MKREINGNDPKGFERFSRRLQNGVEILEHDSIRTITIEDGVFRTNILPRLVVNDAVAKSKTFIAKSRSQLGDIDSFLRSIVRRPIDAK